jgi:hypothetical protein
MNAGRKKVVVDSKYLRDATMRRVFTISDGDRMPFHVSDGFFSCADGTYPIPPAIIHSVSGDEPTLTLSHTENIMDEHGVNETGIDVGVSNNGSMTRTLFPWLAKHFVKNLPADMGKDKKPVILFLDGHTSRWSLEALEIFRQNNVYCICLPSHTSIWSQPNDCGPNSAFKAVFAKAVTAHRQEINIYAAPTLTKGDFNKIFVSAWKRFLVEQADKLRRTESNAAVTGWTISGLLTGEKECEGWDDALYSLGHLNLSPEQRSEIEKRRTDRLTGAAIAASPAATAAEAAAASSTDGDGSSSSSAAAAIAPSLTVAPAQPTQSQLASWRKKITMTPCGQSVTARVRVENELEWVDATLVCSTGDLWLRINHRDNEVKQLATATVTAEIGKSIFLTAQPTYEAVKRGKAKAAKAREAANRARAQQEGQRLLAADLEARRTQLRLSEKTFAEARKPQEPVEVEVDGDKYIIHAVERGRAVVLKEAVCEIIAKPMQAAAAKKQAEKKTWKPRAPISKDGIDMGSEALYNNLKSKKSDIEKAERAKIAELIRMAPEDLRCLKDKGVDSVGIRRLARLVKWRLHATKTEIPQTVSTSGIEKNRDVLIGLWRIKPLGDVDAAIAQAIEDAKLTAPASAIPPPIDAHADVDAGEAATDAADAAVARAMEAERVATTASKTSENRPAGDPKRPADSVAASENAKRSKR